MPSQFNEKVQEFFKYFKVINLSNFSSSSNGRMPYVEGQDHT